MLHHHQKLFLGDALSFHLLLQLVKLNLLVQVHIWTHFLNFLLLFLLGASCVFKKQLRVEYFWIVCFKVIRLKLFLPALLGFALLPLAHLFVVFFVNELALFRGISHFFSCPPALIEVII